MYNESFDEIKGRNTLFDGFIILVSSVMESDIITIVLINTRSGNNRTPWSKVVGTTFRDKGMNMRIPLEVTSGSMKNTDKTGSKFFFLIHVLKYTKDNVSDRGQ